MESTNLRSVDAVIDVLGGTKKVAQLTGCTAAAVSNWRNAGKFPSNTYLLLKASLGDRSHEPPDTLWTMKEPERAAS
jgi:hypothetical protein